MAARTAGGRGRSRRAFVATTLGVALLGAAACSPLTTQRPYAPSDGVRVVLGDEITVENLLILTEAEGEAALVAGGVTNRSTDGTEVTMTFGDSVERTVFVDAGDTVLMPPSAAGDEASGGGAGLVILDASPSAPGTTLPVTIATATSGSTSVQVPVLDGTLSPYDEYIAEYLSDVPAS